MWGRDSDEVTYEKQIMEKKTKKCEGFAKCKKKSR